MSTITHSMLVARASAWLRRNNSKVVLPELYTIGGEIPDAWGMDSSGITCLIECKVSRADFLADAKKYFRRRPEVGLGNMRYYMAPAGIIKPEEIPGQWGLLEVHGRIIRHILEALLPTERGKVDQQDKSFLYSALRRLDCAGILRDGLSVASLQIKVRTEKDRLERELRQLKRQRSFLESTHA